MIKMFIFLGLMTWSFCFANDGGSSGVGSGMAINDLVGSRVYRLSDFKVLSDKIVDAKLDEDLLSIEKIKKSDLIKLQPQLIRAQLGSATEAFEFLSTGKERPRLYNYWIVCKNKSQIGDDSCTKLVPLSQTNPKVIDIIGGLYHK